MRLEHLPEPPLEFGEATPYEVFDPVYGLNPLGPFDYTRERSFDSISIVAIGPEHLRNEFEALWRNLTTGVKRLEYEPNYENGFASIYRLEDATLSGNNSGYIPTDQFRGPIEEKYRSAIQYARDDRRFDVLFIIEPDEYVYYLHDLLRRDCIASGIASQYLERATLGQRRKGSVLHNIAVATYAKAGGMPWRVKHSTVNNSGTIGLSFHLLRGEQGATQRTIVGIAEILDEFGRHLTMKATQANVPQDLIRQFRREFRALYVPRGLMESLVKDALRSTQWPNRMAPTKLVIHKTTPFHEEEVAGLQSALEELEVNLEYALIHIQEETVQRVYRDSDKNALRGMLLSLRDDIPEVVLWPVGKVVSRYRDRVTAEYKYSEKSGAKIGTSDPITVRLDPASRCPSFGIINAAQHVLALTKMRWNTVEMSIRLPVSIYLARQVGGFVVAAMRHDADMTFLNRVDAKHFW